MSRFAPSTERKPSDVPSGAYNGICSRLEGTGVLKSKGRSFWRVPSLGRRCNLSPEYQKRNSVVNRKSELQITSSSACSDGGRRPIRTCRPDTAHSGGRHKRSSLLRVTLLVANGRRKGRTNTLRRKPEWARVPHIGVWRITRE